MSTVNAILATLASVAVLYVAWRLIQSWNRQAAASEALSKSLTASTEALGILPKMVEGLIKVSEQVSQLTILTASVEKFSRLIMGGSGSDGYIEHSDAEKDHEYQIQDLMERGKVSREGAEARLREKGIWENFKLERP